MKKSPDWTSLRILVIDRDIRFRFRLRTLFNRLGVREIITTGDSLRAGELAAHLSFDIVTLDLAEMGAMDFLRQIRPGRATAPGPEIPLLVLAEDKSDYKAAVARGLGIEGELMRPGLSAEAVRDKIAAILAGPVKSEMEDGKDDEDGTQVATRTPRAKPRARAVPVHVKSFDLKRVGAPVDKEPAKDDKISSDWEVEAAGLPPSAEKSEPAFLDPVEPPSPVRRKLQADDEEGAAPEKTERSPKKQVRSKLADESVGPQKKQIEAEPEPMGQVPEAQEKEDDLPSILARHQEWVLTRAARGERANLDGRVIGGVSLAGAVLADAKMQGVELVGADLSGADLRGADLRRAELLGARMTGCNLGVARLRHARMAGCDLTGAFLKGADMAGADLAGVKFGEADLTGANMLSTDLRGADLSQTTGFTRAQASVAITDEKTCLPVAMGSPAPEADEE